ncbi:hypothetical protein [Desulfonatronum sp. SC1]|uniref:hypothetical protein n=1 Tax=Desulfonatronum sp. SC1 TaxID=2109626 RepID=UPI001304867C|nr:hypothetical protein [Desulfonatronum sp. SC1]
MGCPILLVGKYDENRQTVLEAVKVVGQAFSFVPSLQDFERVLGHSGACIVLLDLQMNGVTNAMIRKIKSVRPDVIIIGISGKVFHPELEDALRTHLFAVISKLIDPEELIYCLRSALDLSHCPSAMK